jgi:hypothetical protein
MKFIINRTSGRASRSPSTTDRMPADSSRLGNPGESQCVP